MNRRQPKASRKSNEEDGWIQTKMLSEAISVIERNVRVQSQLIEDLLDMSRIISGNVRLDVQRVELSEIINAAMEGVKPTAKTKGFSGELCDPLSGGPPFGGIFW